MMFGEQPFIASTGFDDMLEPFVRPQTHQLQLYQIGLHQIIGHHMEWWPKILLLQMVPLKSSPISLFRPHGRTSTCVAELRPDVVEISLHRAILNGFRTFCSSKDLSLQKCVPCNKKDLSPMTEGTANVLKPKVPEWELLNDGGVMKLRRKWKVKNFLQGLEFFKIVGDLAEAEGHHPDLHLVRWNNVTIEIWTHACGGLTENDFILAAKIDKLPLESYLRRK